MTGKISGYSASYAAVLTLIEQMRHVTAPEEREALLKEELREALENHGDASDKLEELEDAKGERDEFEAEVDRLDEEREIQEKKLDEATEKIATLERLIDETPDHSLMASLAKENAKLREELKEASRSTNNWIDLANKRFHELVTSKADRERVDRQYRAEVDDLVVALRMFRDGDAAIYLASRTQNIEEWRTECQRLRVELRDLQADPRLTKPLPKPKKEKSK